MGRPNGRNRQCRSRIGARSDSYGVDIEEKRGDSIGRINLVGDRKRSPEFAHQTRGDLK